MMTSLQLLNLAPEEATTEKSLWINKLNIKPIADVDGFFIIQYKTNEIRSHQIKNRLFNQI
jgi:hypothetical protein